MAMIDVAEPLPLYRERQRDVRAPRRVELPSEAEVPETKRHLEARTTLYLLLKDALPGVAIGSDQFVYYDAGDPQKCLSPDVFVKLGAREESFDVWRIWERGAPNLAVEIVSASDRRDEDWATKLERYQASRMTEVVRFDPEDTKCPLRVWDRVEANLLERVPDSPDLSACVALDLWWVVVASPYGPMLRLARDRDGRELLPTPSEERARLDTAYARLEETLAEERRARSAAEHARMLEEHARMAAEEARVAAEQHLREERDARAREREAAQAKIDAVEAERDAAQAAAQAEIERLRAELGRLRGEGR